MARFLHSHILLLVVVLLSLVLGVASDEDYPHHHDHDQHHDDDDHNEMDDHNVNSVNNNINNAEGNENNVPPVDFDARNDIDINANHDRQFLDKDPLEGWEPERRAKVLKIAVAVVSFLLLASLVLNGVLLYKCCTRRRNLTYSKAQEAFQVPMKTAPPCTPPPPYAAELPPKVNAWEEKKELPRY